MKSDNSISWLHLSDLHIAESVEWNIMKIRYEKLAEQLQPKFMIITGDCRKNEASGYAKTLDFLNKLVRLFKIDKKNVFLVPGNHDIDDSSARKAIIKKLVSEMTKNPKECEKYLDSSKDLKKSFRNYSEFIKKFYEEELTNNDERKNNPAGVVHLTWKNQINIILLNTSLISDGDRSHKEILDVEALTRISNTMTILSQHFCWHIILFIVYMNCKESK